MSTTCGSVCLLSSALLAGAVAAGAVAQETPAAGDAPAAPAEPARDASQGILPLIDYSGDLASRSRLSGDWGGLRRDLSLKGVSVELQWTQVAQGVVNGGRTESFDYGGSLDAIVALDLHRMQLIPGGLLRFRAEGRYGETANDDTGQLLAANSDGYVPITQTVNDNVIALTEFNYTQFLGEQFGLTIGRYQTMDADPSEFASGRGRQQFMNFNFLASGVVARTVPYCTLGGGLLWLPNEHITVSSMLLATTDSSTTSGFDTLDDGWTWATELRTQYRLGTLPGGINVGALYAFDGDFAQLGGQLTLLAGEGLVFPSTGESWAAYASIWQYLYSMDEQVEKVMPGSGRPSLRGFGLFSRFGIADNETNPVDWTLSGGLGGRGMLPTRDNDTFGVAYVYTAIEELRPIVDRRLDDSTQALEAFYTIAITPAVGLTFDVQWMTSAARNVDDATLLALRLDIQF